MCMTVRSVCCVLCISCGDFLDRPCRQVSNTDGRGALIASGTTPKAKAGPSSVDVCAQNQHAISNLPVPLISSISAAVPLGSLKCDSGGFVWSLSTLCRNLLDWGGMCRPSHRTFARQR